MSYLPQLHPLLASFNADFLKNVLKSEKDLSGK